MEEQKGFLLTGNFWSANMAALRQNKRRTLCRWAGFGSATAGKEMTENHDTVFLNYYSSVLAIV